ncbi:OmpA family protein [Candidatus Venteria ishoeyi]|uniref:OmpA family protein n=1 Tax=Candidatus Venteria ishoeyi TaxID=1899563 RepID=UPI0025A51425|nr:OmpA family protein [Candidatus Venteria ishoeyi]MDM8547300.1 OmpA family protein [Candidatus Venteria ishoeyi]
MNKIYTQLFFVTLLTVLLSACGALEKSTNLKGAEAAYNKAKGDPEVIKYAASQLDSAEKTLKQAANAETAEEMRSLAYIADNQVKTAMELTATKQAEAKIAHLSTVSSDLALQAREQEAQRARMAAEKARLAEEKARAEKNRLQQELAALQAKKTDRGMVMTLGDVLFATGKADLMPGAVSTLQRLADFLQQHPEKNLKIEGHTDSTGSSSMNLQLSENRANAVRSALTAKGVDSGRIQTIGLGMSQPIAPNKTKEGRQRNRRVDIIIQ